MKEPALRPTDKPEDWLDVTDTLYYDTAHCRLRTPEGSFLGRPIGGWGRPGSGFENCRVVRHRLDLPPDFDAGVEEQRVQDIRQRREDNFPATTHQVLRVRQLAEVGQAPATIGGGWGVSGKAVARALLDPDGLAAGPVTLVDIGNGRYAVKLGLKVWERAGRSYAGSPGGFVDPPKGWPWGMDSAPFSEHGDPPGETREDAKTLFREVTSMPMYRQKGTPRKGPKETYDDGMQKLWASLTEDAMHSGVLPQGATGKAIVLEAEDEEPLALDWQAYYNDRPQGCWIHQPTGRVWLAMMLPGMDWRWRWAKEPGGEHGGES